MKRVIEIEPGEGIQEAIDSAVSQGGKPWVVLLNPGVYEESGIVTADGVNITSRMERTVLITADSTEPTVTAEGDVAIAGVTIEQLNADYPALQVEEAVQCSLHRSILIGASGGLAVLQHQGFLRAFDTDVRFGRVVLAPTVNYPVGNPVGLNCIRCRLWHDDIWIEGALNALFMLEQCSLQGVSVRSSATGHVAGKVYGTTGIHTLENTGTFTYEVRDSDMYLLAARTPESTVEVWGGFFANSDQTGDFIVHDDARHHWLEVRVNTLEGYH